VTADAATITVDPGSSSPLASPSSSLSPAGQPIGVRFPARTVPVDWPATGQDRVQVLRLVAGSSRGLAPSRIESNQRLGLPLLLDWLQEQPGQTWQQRWLASGADAAGEAWAQGPARWLEGNDRYSQYRLELMTSSLMVAVGADIVRPSLSWLLTGGRKRKLARNMIRSRDREGFDRLGLLCRAEPGITPQAAGAVLFRTAVIIAAKGGTISDIVIGDVLEVLDAEFAVRGKTPTSGATFRMLRELGIFGVGVPTLREIRSPGQRSVEELVDRYPITCRQVRDLLVDYLKERQPAVDYSTLRTLTYSLARCFWLDLERHHPGIDSLRLPREVAGAWKRRLQTRSKPTTAGAGEQVTIEVERLSYLDTLASVRAFYLDLAEWALEDPGRWGPWVAPCPVSPQELGRRTAVRRRKARMDARTRQRLPVLPILVRAAGQWRQDAQVLLTTATATPAGQQFTAAGQTLVRSLRPHASGRAVWAHEPDTGRQRQLTREADHAFWAWAIIEVFRLTGVRAEELQELSHHSLVQYRLPSTGELVPLLQIAPSKTDTERLLVVSPELADVLAAIISRLRDRSGAIPLVRARDRHERLWQPPAPLLFQHRTGTENHMISLGLICALLDEALARTELTDPADGTPLHYTPHDFRRIFITDAVLNGLPPHIAQVIAGHHNIAVTMGYKAVYPDEAIQAHLAFLARRRALRPSEEYRTPSDQEWTDFLGHFERRKVSTGACGRAFATPCIHEHACIRCPMLWPDPAQRDRLLDIRDNLNARITEAQREGWLGEVEGLQLSLAGAQDKLAQIDRRAATTTVDLGLPNLQPSTDRPHQQPAPRQRS